MKRDYEIYIYSPTVSGWVLYATADSDVKMANAKAACVREFGFGNVLVCLLERMGR